MNLESMYQEVILDHYKNPTHAGLKAPFDAEVHHVNPSCGDELTLRVKLSDDKQTVVDVSYEATGCSISQASVSVMAEEIVGKPLPEALDKLAEFEKMITSRGHYAGVTIPGTCEMRPAGLESIPGSGGGIDGGTGMTEENGIPTRTDLADIPEQTPEDKRKRDEVEECMRDVIDPELGINVVDLGLVYSIWIENGVDAHIEMTLTSPACPLTDVLEEQAQEAVVGSGVVENLTLDWVWMPPWGPNMITEEGREQLRALGFNV